METAIMGYGYIVGPYKGNIGVMLGLHWGYIGIMENDMETTIWAMNGCFLRTAGLCRCFAKQLPFQGD